MPHSLYQTGHWQRLCKAENNLAEDLISLCSNLLSHHSFFVVNVNKSILGASSLQQGRVNKSTSPPPASQKALAVFSGLLFLFPVHVPPLGILRTLLQDHKHFTSTFLCIRSRIVDTAGPDQP
jgi:hypothetical protein